MIEAFRLIRFRGFEDTKWIVLRPLTLFFGHNSSGKSSLLAGLLMLRQSVLNPDRSTPLVFTSDLGVDLGSYEDLVFGHRYDPKRPLSLSLRLRFDEPFLGWTLPIREVLLRFQVGYDKPRKVAYLLAAGIFDTEERKLFEVWRLRQSSNWQLSSDIFSPQQFPEVQEITWEHFLPLPVINACKNLSWDHLSVLSLIRTRSHVVALDTEGKVLAEYRGNCSGIELFEKWYQEIWQRVQQVSGLLEKQHVTRLTHLGCHESSDHVFVAVAKRTDRYLVTEDSDFGKGHLNRALAKAKVTVYMREKLGLIVHDAKEACNHLSGAGP